MNKDKKLQFVYYIQNNQYKENLDKSEQIIQNFKNLDDFLSEHEFFKIEFNKVKVLNDNDLIIIKYNNTKNKININNLCDFIEKID